MLITVQINIIQTQNSTLITDPKSNQLNLDYDGILGVGWGVFAIICSILLGIIICICGFSTTSSLLMFTIGFSIPLIVFLMMVLSPLEVVGETEIYGNESKNNFIVVRWLIFTLVFIALLTTIIPFLKLWTVVLVPQRVDSRTQKEYLEKVERIILDKKDEGPDNSKAGEGNSRDKKLSIFNEPEILPLNNQFVPQNQQQDIEMVKTENLVNKERKRKLGALKRKIHDEEN